MTLPRCLEFFSIYWGLGCSNFAAGISGRSTATEFNKTQLCSQNASSPSGCSPPRARQSSSSRGCEDSCLFSCIARKRKKLSLNILIHTFKSTEKYSTNNKTNRCIRKFSNKASAVKNLYLQIFMKNMEQMFLNRAFWECDRERPWHNQLKFSVSLC